jgi:hypothetical protein
MDYVHDAANKTILAKLEQHSSSEMPTILPRVPYRAYF